MVFSEYASRAGCNHLLAQVLRGVDGQSQYDHVGENPFYERRRLDAVEARHLNVH